MTQLKLITYKKVLKTEKTNQQGKAPINVRCYQRIAGKRKIVYLPTGISIPPKYWDEKKLQIKRTYPGADQLNDEIDAILRKARDFEMNQRRKHGRFLVTRIREYEQHTDKILSFTEFFALELEQDNRIKEATKRARRVTLQKLIDYNRKRPVYFDQVDYSFVIGFDRYLRGRDYHQNYIHKQHKIVKTYLKRAIDHQLFQTDKNPYNRFKSPTIETGREFLLPDELDRLQALTFEESEEPLERVRDMFLLQCFLSLRYGDVKRVCKRMIERTEAGMILTIQTEKTGKPLTLPVYAIWREKGEELSKPERILNKYLEKYREIYSGTSQFDKLAFFNFSNAYTNRLLKKLAHRAGIKKKLTTHVARHTFTTLTAPKVPMAILQAMLTHSDPRTTQKYLHNNAFLLAEELKKVQWE